MCWSPFVSLFFATAESLCLAYMWLRNRAFDRANVVFLLPLLAQEVLQALLWPEVTEDRTEALGWDDPALHRCTSRNSAYSYAIVIAVCGVPVGWTWRALAENRMHREALDDSRAPAWASHVGRLSSFGSRALTGVAYAQLGGLFFIGCLFATPMLFVPYLASTRLDDVYACCARCTTRGAHGHQVWPMTVWKSRVTETVVAAAYAVQGGLGFKLLPRPSLLPAVFSHLAVAAVALYVWMGPEAGSVWCWAASTTVLICLAEPWLLDASSALDARLRGTSPDARRRVAQLGGGSAGDLTLVKLAYMLLWTHIDNLHPAEDRGTARETDAGGHRFSWRDAPDADDSGDSESALMLQ